MKEVMQQYGKAIIQVVVVLLLISILFGGLKIGEAKGLPAILASETEKEGIDYSTYQDGDKSAFVMQRQRPVICFSVPEVVTGQEYAPEDLFKAEDMEGNPAKIKILKIMNHADKEVELVDNHMKFEAQGIYRILVKAIDSYCGVTENEFLVPVKRR